MKDVYIVGSHSTAFGKKPTESFKSLARETITGVLADAQLETGQGIDFAYFGNCAMHGVKQGTIRGQALTIELVDERLLQPRMPMINVEGGCATGSMTIHSAMKDIRSGASDLVLAFGVEKLFIPRAATDPAMKQKMMKGFMNGVDNFATRRGVVRRSLGASARVLEWPDVEDDVEGSSRRGGIGRSGCRT